MKKTRLNGDTLANAITYLTQYKMHLTTNPTVDDTVDPDDIDAIIDALHNELTYHALSVSDDAFDPKPSNNFQGFGSPDENPKSAIKTVLCGKAENQAEKSELLDEATEYGHDRTELLDAIKELLMQGHIYERSPDVFRHI